MRKKTFHISMVFLLLLSLFAPLPGVAIAQTEAVAADLLISEYVEGSSNNKAIELYNSTGVEIDLTDYTLELYANGATNPNQTLNLAGKLGNNETFVIVNSQASNEMKAYADIEHIVTSFNGDDALVLKKSGEAIDSFGQVGARELWGEDVTLVRKSTVYEGDSVIDDAFNPNDEWIEFPKDTFDNLGKHQLGESTGTPDPEVPAEVLTIAEARAIGDGQEVTVKAVVAGKLKNTISVQDETGGLAVRPTSLKMNLGEEVVLTGKLADYRGLMQLDNAKVVKNNGQVGEPTAKIIKGTEVGEANESLLVTVENLQITEVVDGGTWANYKVTDGNAEFLVRDENNELGLAVGNQYDSITGIVQQFDEDYQIIPRSSSDIVLDASMIQPATANPGTGTFVKETTVTLSTATKDAKIYYTIDSTEPTVENGTEYTNQIHITEDTVLKAIVVKGDEQSAVQAFTYTIVDALQIHDIQGENHTSPYENQTVEGIEGIVTYEYELNGSTYYHIQTPDNLADDNPNTSEAIVLYSGKNKWPIRIGDLVSVTGKVSEYAIDGYNDRQTTDLKTTQINVRNDQGGLVAVVKHNVELPKPITINEDNLPTAAIDSDGFEEFNPDYDAIDFWESLEAMRVEVGNVKAVAPQEHGDLATVLENRETNSLHGGILLEENQENPDRIQFRLEPNQAARDFEVATGDEFKGPITGVVGYSFQNYKIFVSLDEMKAKHIKGDAKPEVTTLVKAEDKLAVASYNLENFSNNKSSTTDDKARKLARAFVKDMQNPDIIGVTEVQDNDGQGKGGPEANESYERLIKAIKDAGGVTYEYANIDPVHNADGGAPDSNIRVGFLYNPERVQFTEGLPKGYATTAVGYKNGSLTHNPGRIDPKNEAFKSSRKPLVAQFEFKGEDVIVIANHWNSKNGDTPTFGQKQPPVRGSEVQRHKIANIVNDFISDIKTKNPDANIVSLGDFNDFQFSKSLKIHEGEHMTNMINKLDQSDRYTYVFQGNSQVLDHILVSNNLVEQTEVDVLHINADFTDMAGRASDHDPVLVQIDFGEGIVEPPVEFDQLYFFKNFKTKKLSISKPKVSVTLEDTAEIAESLTFTGEYGLFKGQGLTHTKVILKPAKDGAIIDFTGGVLEKVIVDGTHVKEILGAENIQSIEFINGANADDIQFTNSKGEPIAVPSSPSGNRAPVVKSEIPNQSTTVNQEIQLALSSYFEDLDGDELTYSATKGTIDAATTVLTLQLEEGTHVVGVTASDGKDSVTQRFSVTVTAVEAPTDSYYTSAIGKEGQALKAALHDIISDHKQLSYKEVWDGVKDTDEDPNNPNNVILFYSNKSRAKSANGGGIGQWNREHVWAKSHGNFGTSKGPGTDLHHLRATDVQVNSARGNLDFDNGGSTVEGCDGCKKSSNSWEPPNHVKGDVARILFYMASRYEKGDKVDLELNDKLNNGKAPYHGKLSTLLEWHLQDPVDEIERTRNDKIQAIQGNRNPFIDHPEWVELIWNTNGNAEELDQAS